MNKFRKKPVVIEAFEWKPNAPMTADVPLWYDEACMARNAYPESDGTLSIKTLEGTMVAQPGDWIIRGVKGEIYPCKPDIFAATYECAAVPASPVQPPQDVQQSGLSHADAKTCAGKAAWIAVTERMPEAGVPVLAFVTNSAGKTRRIRASYAPPKTIEASGEDINYEAAEYAEEEDQYWLREGWYEQNEYEEVHWHVDDPVSHWMPLPAPPAEHGTALTQDGATARPLLSEEQVSHVMGLVREYASAEMRCQERLTQAHMGRAESAEAAVWSYLRNLKEGE
jgi:hypothetical protein